MGIKLSEWRLKMTDGGIPATLAKITSAGDKAAGRIGGLQAKLSQMEGGLKNAAAQVPGLNQVLESVSNPYTALAAGVLAVGAATVKATGMAMDFEKGMAQINTTARLAPPALADLRNELLRMGGQSTVNLESIPGAFNQVISAVGDTKKSLDIFEPALKAAQAGFTDIKTVTEAATNVMGSVGKATPTEVFDTLFATMRVGKAEFADIANYLPKIIPLANNVGIKYQEIAGAFALMTGKGQSAEQAAMLLQNAMVSLSKSEVIYGSKSKAGFERSGIAIFNQAGKMRQLVDIVGDLSKKTAGMNDKQKQAFLAGLGLDAQASASFSVMAQYAGELRGMVGETTNSAGEMSEAFERSLNPVDRFTMLSNQFKEQMTQVGYKILPYVNLALDKTNQYVGWIKDNSALFKEYVEASLAPVRLLWSAMKGIYNLSVEFGGMGNLIEGLFGGSGDIWPDVKQFLSNFYQSINVLLQAIDDASEGKFKSALNRFSDFNSKLTAEASMKSYNPSVAAGLFGENGGLNALLAPSKSALDSIKPPPGGSNLPPPPSGSGGGKLKGGLKAVTDGGRQVRNVVVNINGGLVKEMKIITGTNQTSKADLEDFIKETIIRAVNGAEQALQ